MPAELMLVGSVPLDTAAEVFDVFGGPLGPHMAMIPDGEPGPRKNWISRVHYQVLVANPDLEVINRPAREDGVERLMPRGHKDSWRFKVKDGVTHVRFGDPGWRLGFARDAINSYFVFKTLRDQGKLAKHLRFQVSIPSVTSTLPVRLFDDPADAAKVRPGYQEALVAEVAKIVEKIPNEDLAMQWDCAAEVQEAYGVANPAAKDTAIARNVGQITALSKVVPENVKLGFHLCFGTLGGWPRFVPSDLSQAVDLGNAFIDAAQRRVDWIHIPVLPEAKDAFFAPLVKLKPQGARVYLGMVHHVETLPERIASARKFLPDFGLAAYCGFGRLEPAEMPAVLNDHVQALRLAK